MEKQEQYWGYIFYGNGFRNTLKAVMEDVEVNDKEKVFSYYVTNSQSFGDAPFDENSQDISIE